MSETPNSAENKNLASAVQQAQASGQMMSDQEQIKSVEEAIDIVPVAASAPQQVFANLPYELDTSKWPKVRIKAIRMYNFGPHDDVEINFGNHGLHCLVGPNGTGKTTTLAAIQSLFGNFTGYEQDRFQAKTLRWVRNFMFMDPVDYPNANFVIQGLFEITETNCQPRDYTIELSRLGGGFTGAHPGVVRFNLPHYCFMSRFDQELHIFQCRRNRWPLFCELFEAVTGFKVEEDRPELDGKELSQSASHDEASAAISRSSIDRKMQKIQEEHVLGFKVHKPRETITQKQCSAGERKIAKALSTILNKQIQPNIILIDNITDHVELGRHLPVIAAIEKCFPNSQIIATCHSQPVQRHLPKRDRLIDLRFLHCHEQVKQEPWRMRLYDEVVESMDKIHSLPASPTRDNAESNAAVLMKWLVESPDKTQDELVKWSSKHLADVAQLFGADVAVNSFPPRIHLL